MLFGLVLMDDCISCAYLKVLFLMLLIVPSGGDNFYNAVLFCSYICVIWSVGRTHRGRRRARIGKEGRERAREDRIGEVVRGRRCREGEKGEKFLAEMQLMQCITLSLAASYWHRMASVCSSKGNFLVQQLGMTLIVLLSVLFMLTKVDSYRLNKAIELQTLKVQNSSLVQHGFTDCLICLMKRN